MMDAMARLCGLIAVIYEDVLVPDGEMEERRENGKDGAVRLTFGEPEPLNYVLKEPVIYVSTDAMDFSWRDVSHCALQVAYPVYALVYYPREDDESMLLAGDFVERLAAELTAEDRWFGNIPGFIEQPSADYLGFDKSTNCHKWALYFEYRRLPVPRPAPFTGDVPLGTVTINWASDIEDTWTFWVTQFEKEPPDVDWSWGEAAIDVPLPQLIADPRLLTGDDYETSQLPDGLAPNDPRRLLTATDDDGAVVVVYTASPLPPGLAFNPLTRELTGTPTENGVTTVTYRASKDRLGTVTAEFTITVTGLSIVGPMTRFRVEPADVTWNMGDDPIGVTLPALAFDPAGVSYVALALNPTGVDYAATPLPGWLAFDPATRDLTGTPTENGVTTVTYRASKYGLDPVMAEFTITVTGF